MCSHEEVPFSRMCGTTQSEISGARRSAIPPRPRAQGGTWPPVEVAADPWPPLGGKGELPLAARPRGGAPLSRPTALAGWAGPDWKEAHAVRGHLRQN